MLVAFNDCIIPDGFANNSNFQAYQCFDIHIITIAIPMCLPLRIYNYIIHIIHYYTSQSKTKREKRVYYYIIL